MSHPAGTIAKIVILILSYISRELLLLLLPLMPLDSAATAADAAKQCRYPSESK